jgi:hypothetical protein
VRVHGNVYKIPDIDQDKIDDLANVFLIDTDVDELSPPQQAQARNVTKSIFVVQQGDVSVTMDFVNNVGVDPDESGGAINAVRARYEICCNAVTNDVLERRCSKDQIAVQHHSRRRL